MEEYGTLSISNNRPNQRCRGPATLAITLPLRRPSLLRSYRKKKIYDNACFFNFVYFLNSSLSEGDLNASRFASSVIDFINDKCTKKIPIILYSHGCSCQNRNTILSNALLNYSIKIWLQLNKSSWRKGTHKWIVMMCIP